MAALSDAITASDVQDILRAQVSPEIADKISVTERLAGKFAVSLDLTHIKGSRAYSDDQRIKDVNIQAMRIIAEVLDKCAATKDIVNASVKLRHIDFSHSDTTTRALFHHGYFNETKFKGETINSFRAYYGALRKQVTSLDYSNSELHAIALDNLSVRLPKITFLKADHCERLYGEDISAPGSPSNSLKHMSLVGTHITAQQLRRLEAIFPDLIYIDVSQDPKSLFMGIKDITTFETSYAPTVLKCGHVFDKEVVEKVSTCPNCRDPITKKFPANFTITRLEKNENGWGATVLDFNRNPLGEAVYFHPACGNLFTQESLGEIFGFDGSNTLERAQCYQCPGCAVMEKISVMDLMRVYPSLEDE